MNRLFKCFRKLKMNQQVTIFGSFIMTIVLLVILGTCLVQTQILFKYIQTSSEMITTKQERRSIERSSIRIKEYLKRKYHRSLRNVMHISEFFEAAFDIQEREYQISNQLFPSCAKQTGSHKKSRIKYDTNLFCYQSLLNSDGITLPQNDNQIDFFNMTISLLSEYSLLFDVSNETQLFIFDLPKTQMMITYPQNYQPKNYTISNRTWFQYYLNQLDTNPNQTFYISPVYLSAITNQLNMAVIASIQDQLQNPIGFTAQSILLSDENVEAIPTNIILVNNQGEIIFTSDNTFGEATEQIYIYNTTYTGFNETDWNLIQLYANHGNLSSYSCNGFQNTFCLYNKYFNSTVQVNALNFENEDFTLVVFVNVTYQSQLANQFFQLTGRLSASIIQIEWILITVCFAMLLVTAFLIQIIFHPLFKLMVHIKLHLKTLGNNLNKEILTMTRRLVRKSNIFSKLTIRFMTLQDILSISQVTKSTLCLQIEKFSYNMNPVKVDIQKIKELALNLKDKDSLQSSKSSREIFKQSLIQLYKKY